MFIHIKQQIFPKCLHSLMLRDSGVTLNGTAVDHLFSHMALVYLWKGFVGTVLAPPWVWLAKKLVRTIEPTRSNQKNVFRKWVIFVLSLLSRGTKAVFRIQSSFRRSRSPFRQFGLVRTKCNRLLDDRLKRLSDHKPALKHLFALYVAMNSNKRCEKNFER